VWVVLLFEFIKGLSEEHLVHISAMKIIAAAPKLARLTWYWPSPTSLLLTLANIYSSFSNFKNAFQTHCVNHSLHFHIWACFKSWLALLLRDYFSLSKMDTKNLNHSLSWDY